PRVVIEPGNINPILSQICVQHEAAARISTDHMGILLVMAVKGKAARRGCSRNLGPHRIYILMGVCGRPKRSGWQYGQHRNTAAAVVRHKYILAGSVDTQ